MSSSITIKVIIIGDASVGKTAIMNRYVKDSFQDNYTATIGVSYSSKVLRMDDYDIQLQIWDTAGQEIYRSITRSYYRGAQVAIIVYDITKKETFDAIPIWLNEINSNCTPECNKILVGNKSDCENERDVSQSATTEFLQQHDITMIETSAKTGQNISDLFEEAISQYLARTGAEVTRKETTTEKIEIANPPKDKKKCC